MCIFQIESNKFEFDNKILDIREIIIIIIINSNLFSIKLFFIHDYFISQKKIYFISFFANIEIINYIFIDQNLISEICERLNIDFIFLIKLKKIKKYDNKIAKKFITKIIYLN